jgi:hypothetical protein
MPGPPPKAPELRQRRNKTATRAVLPAEESPLLPESAEGEPAERVIPPLPPRGRKKWHPMAVVAWADWWSSPMATEFLRADLHGLYVLIDLVDQYWRKPSSKLAGEIRQQRTCFGLTPIDRRRLQWEVEKAEEAQDKGRRRQKPEQPSQSEEMEADPRKRMRIV